MHSALGFVASFLACAVEMVEALTIVLAVAVTRGWRSAAAGTAAALVVLAVVVAVFGPALSRLPIDGLRLAVGALLLVFGLQWLRKSVLRAAGLKAKHDEAAIYATQLARLDPDASSGADTGPGGAEPPVSVENPGRADPPGRLDWYGFTVACKGVLLEGLEVAFIVVTFGSAQHDVGVAALGAGAALVVVVAVGALVHAPLTRVPENTLKFVVGVMLTSFGTFWAAEGAGISWPGGDASLLAVLGFVVLVSIGCVTALRRAPVLGASSR